MMDNLEELLRYVSQLAAEGFSNEVIDAELELNNHTRASFEEAVRRRIESQMTRPDKSMVDRAIGTLREQLDGRTLGFAEPLEALVRMMGSGAPGMAGMAARFLSSGLSIEDGQLRSRDFENIRGDIRAERENMQQVLPGQSTLAQATGALKTGQLEGQLVNKFLPALNPVKGQFVGNAARRAGEAGIVTPVTAGTYYANQGDEDVGQNTARDTLITMAAGPVLGPVVEGVARGGDAAMRKLMPGAGAGGAGMPPQPPAGSGLVNKGEYDPYFQGLSKFGDALSEDRITVDMARAEAQRQAAAAGAEEVLPVDIGGVNTQRFAKTLYSTPGEQADIAQRALEGRQLQQGPRMQAKLEEQLTAGKDPQVFAREQAALRKEQLNPEYQKVMDMGLPEGLNPELRQLLDADPRMAEYYQAARNRETSRRGNPDPGDFAGNMNLRMVETARRGLSGEERKALRAGDMDEAESLGTYRRRLMEQADTAVPRYGELRGQGFDSRRLEEVASQAKKDFYRARPEIMRDDFNKLNDVEQDAYRAGFVREFHAYLDPKISDSATKGNIARYIDKKSLKERIEILFDSPEQFARYWESVMVEARRSKSYISTIGDATRNTQQMQSMAADNLVDPSPLDEAIQGTNFLGRMRDLSNVMQTREAKRVAEAFGPQFYGSGLDNTMGLLNDVELAQQMRNYYNLGRAERMGGTRAAVQSLLD